MYSNIAMANDKEFLNCSLTFIALKNNDQYVGSPAKVQLCFSLIVCCK